MKTKKQILAIGLFAFCTAYIMYRMLFYAYEGAIRQPFEDYHFNFIPLKTISHFFLKSESYSDLTLLMNLFANIAVFAPFGGLVALYNHRLKVKKVFVFSFCFILCLETIQGVTKRGVWDIDDLILNVFGMLIGYLIGQKVLNVVFDFMRNK
jgi:glycopeptide antibiotics resistance protein